MYNVGDSVYVNGRKGVVTGSSDDGYTIKTLDTGYIGTYTEDKIIVRHKHCMDCNRRISDDSNTRRCRHCRSKRQLNE